MIDLIRRTGMVELLQPDQLPTWFTYPARFRSVLNQGLVDLHPWHMLPRDNALIRLKWLSRELPELQLVPFAIRLDVGFDACFERGSADSVAVIVADERPFRLHVRFASFEDWVRTAIEDVLTFEASGSVWEPPDKRRGV